MTQAFDYRPALPPFWLPIAAAIPLVLCLVLLALPSLGHGVATAARTLYVFAFMVWVVPLTALQRQLYRRGASAVITVATLLVATFAMTLAARATSLLLQGAASDGGHQIAWSLLLFRGIEGAWLSLIAYCAIHAVVAHSVALRRERAFHDEARALARDAELAALRYQLQPHFLFNTLNAISSLVAEQRGPEARDMLARLADFLRLTLESGRCHKVSLAEELAVTENYLDIERARFGDRLRVRWNLGTGVLGARVPYLLLQPLVENAIRHGIAPRRDAGQVEITVNCERGELRIRLSNDLPAPRDRISDDPTREAVGLANVRKRLAHLYGDAFGLEHGIGDDGRFHVQLTLPLCGPNGAAS